MKVWLLRHGIAEDHAPGGDEARALTKEGEQRLRRAAPAWARAIGSLDSVYASPLLRAQQTARILCKALGHDDGVETAAEITPSGRPLLALERIQHDLHAGRHAIALVGHEPHLGCLLGLLLTGSERASLPFKKGMLVGVDLDSPASLIGRLVVALTTRVAAQLADD